MINIKKLILDNVVSDEMKTHMANMKKPVGSFGYDPWGFSIDGATIGLYILKQIHDKYFRTKAYGLENIPKTGRIMLIPNHSGQLPLDGILLGVSVATNAGGPRAARAMVEKFVPDIPFVGNLMNKVGGVIGDPINCVKMLQREEAVIIFPEGAKGSGKLYKNRYQLQRFGNGFMHLAINNDTPIIPVGVVGCEETIPAIANIKPLARLLNIPYVPVALPIPLPAKVIFNIGKPMYFTGNVDNEGQVAQKVDQVKDEINILIKKGLSQRKRIFY